MKILSAEQIFQADRLTIANEKISSSDLMERAGNELYKYIHSDSFYQNRTFHFFCGRGNNGGDGLVLARKMFSKNFHIKIYLLKIGKPSEDFSLNLQRIKKKGITVEELNAENDFPEVNKDDIIVDAIFGIGLNRSPEGWIKNLIQYLNSKKAFVLAIDIPTGLFANRPLTDKETVIKADLTLTFQVPKMAFFIPESSSFMSDFRVLDIGLDADFISGAKPLATLVSREKIQAIYEKREKFGHKGTYGHTLIIAGSYGKMGACILSVKAAFRAGAGMVTAFIPACGYQIMQTTVPEAMVIVDADLKEITNIEFDFKPSSIAIGMGTGTSSSIVKAFKTFLKNHSEPLVIDADALNIISKNKEFLEYLPKLSVLTPHPKELERLIGTWENDFDKIEKTKNFSKIHQVIVVIKGAYSMIIFEEEVFINTSGNPGMATAGSGDALSGIIAAMLSQKYPPLTAAIFGVFIHGLAGDKAAGKSGLESMMAGDIIEALPQAFLELQ